MWICDDIKFFLLVFRSYCCLVGALYLRSTICCMCVCVCLHHFVYLDTWRNRMESVSKRAPHKTSNREKHYYIEADVWQGTHSIASLRKNQEGRDAYKNLLVLVICITPNKPLHKQFNKWNRYWKYLHKFSLDLLTFFLCFSFISYPNIIHIYLRQLH